MFEAVNSATARLSANMVAEGRIVLFDPVEGFASITGFVDLGLFPDDATIFPAADITRDTIRALNPEGGASIVVDERVTDTTITYDFPVLTPDDTVRALHNGAPSVALADTDLAGVKVSPFQPGASILGRLIIVAKRPGTDSSRLFRVFWHPRAALQANGLGDSQGEETLLFQASVRAFTYTVGADFTDVATQITPYGAIFTVPASKLDALLTKLEGEALPA